MKRLILLLSLILITTAASATQTVGALRIKQGSWSAIKDDNATAYVCFDYSETKWFLNQSYEEHCGDTYELRTGLSLTDFIASFNENSKGLKMSTDIIGAKYYICFNISNMEQWQMSSMYGRLSTFVHGEIEVLDMASGEILCKIAVKGHSGNEDYVPEDRISKCFKSLAKRLVKLKK